MAMAGISDQQDTQDRKEDGMPGMEAMTWKTHLCQELYEVAGSFEGEAGFQKSSDGCAKNPGHHAFEFISDFSIDSLDPCYQDNDIVELVKIQSKMTVCLKVKGVSKNRPDNYPYYKDRGFKNLTMSGSGCLSSVIMYEEKCKSKCTCQSCQTATRAQNVKGRIMIKTAKHVVFDNKEASNTKCYFFYDTPNTEMGQLLTLSNFTVEENSTTEDWCTISCATHDDEVLNQLHELRRQYGDLCRKVREKYNANQYTRVRRETDDPPTFDSKPRLVVITSHPHGRCKRITIGEWTERCVVVLRKVWTRYAYTTATCPGSSGAPIYILGMDDEEEDFHHPHSGASEIDGINLSGAAHDESSKCRSVQKELKAKSKKKNSLRDKASRLPDLLCDKAGSRFIERELTRATLDEKNMVFDAIQRSPFVMTHEHGHIVFNTMLKTGSPDQIKMLTDRVIGRLFYLANDTYGRKIIKQAMIHKPADTQVLEQYLKITELQNSIVQLMRDSVGAKVITSLLERGHKEDVKVVIKTVRENLLTLTTDRYGVEVIKFLLERGSEDDINMIVKTVRENMLTLTTDRYGIGVIKFLLEHGREEDIGIIVKTVSENVLTLCTNQYGAEVIKFLLKRGLKDGILDIANVVRENVITLSTDRTGASVIKFLLEHGHKEDIRVITKALKENGLTLGTKKHPLGRKHRSSSPYDHSSQSQLQSHDTDEPSVHSEEDSSKSE